MTPDKPSDTVAVYADAIVAPCKVRDSRTPSSGGIFDRDREIIKPSLCMRHLFPIEAVPYDKPSVETDPDVRTEYIVRVAKLGETEQTLKGSHVFGGYIFPHYGHFLLESLARLWFFKNKPELPVLWVSYDGKPFQAWQLEILQLLGVKNEMKVISVQTAVEELILPQPGYVISNRFWPCQAEALAVAKSCAVVPGKKIWLSRSGFTKGAILNEPILEKALQADGWTIYHPDEHSVSDQIKMLSDAEHVAGLEGSGFHTLILMPHFSGHVSVVSRVKKMDFELIAKTLGHSLTRLTPWTIWLPRLDGHWDSEAVGWWRDLDEILQDLGVCRAIKGSQPIKRSLVNVTESLINYYKAEKFAELWPVDNSVLEAVSISGAFTVSANAGFDVRAQRKAGIRHLDIAPEIFFATDCLRAMVDIFCFRAARTCDEALRVFNLTLDFSHPDTLWVIEADDAADANVELVELIQKTNPAISVAWVTDKGVAVLWRSRRSYSPAALHPFRREDLGQAKESTIPRMKLRAIVEKIDSGKGKPRVNAL